jgi:hypothetical protein
MTGGSTRCREAGGVNGLAQTAALETEICGQRLWARRAEKGPLNPAIRQRRPALSAQVTEIWDYFRPREITALRADFLVELRGFKPRCIWRCVGECERFSIDFEQLRLE